MISVITVCYNAEKEIEKTMQSVLMQTYTEYEYVFIDGLSQDSTLDIINNYVSRFEGKGIRVKIISEKDQGIYDAMNKGISIANGDWINFMNAGDCFHDENVLEQMAEYLLDECAVVAGEYVYIEGYLGKRHKHVNLEKIREGMIFCHQAVFTAKKAFELKVYDTKYKYCADYEWLLDMYLRGKEFKCVDILVADFDTRGIAYQNREVTEIESDVIRRQYGLDVQGSVKKRKVDLVYDFKDKAYKFIAHNKELAKAYYSIWSKMKERYLFLE